LLFSSLKFANTTTICSKEILPRIGKSKLVEFWSALHHSEKSISDVCLDILSETRKPEADAIALTVPRAASYFISAIPGTLSRKKVLSLTFQKMDEMRLVHVLLNSNIFYWYVRAIGDGFLLGVDTIGSFPVPNAPGNEYLTLSQKLDMAMSECATYQSYRGQQVISYNFNKRIDILMEIDRWLVSKVAPELDLPDNIFVQAKSNSFLRPFNLGELAGDNDLEGDE
jgi:hypothetical protein